MKFFILALVFSVHAFADNRDWCGDFKQVIFKPQKFKVVTEDGFIFSKIVHKSKAGAFEAIWNGEDWFSAVEFHETPTTVSFDEASNVYTVGEFKVKPKSRWKILAGCKDIVDSLEFEVNWGKREDGVNLKYHRGVSYVSLEEYRDQKKVVVATNPEPYSVVLRKRDIVEGRLLSHDYFYDMELIDGRKVKVISASFDRPEEGVVLKKAYDTGKSVRLYGRLVEDSSDDEIRFFYDYVDVL